MGLAINSREVLGFYICTLCQSGEKSPKNGPFGPLARFNCSELLKIGLNESPGPSDQFPRGLRLFYFHSLTKWQKKALKLGLFGTRESFTFLELIKMGPNESSRPSVQFPRGFRLSFSQLDQVPKKGSKNGLFWALASFNFSELLKIGPNESPGPSDQFPRGLRLLYFHTLTKWRKKALKMGFFGTWASFNFLELRKIGPNESAGPSDQFPRGFRL